MSELTAEQREMCARVIAAGIKQYHDGVMETARLVINSPNIEKWNGKQAMQDFVRIMEDSFK